MQWLIDGHNLIGQLPTLRLDDPHDEAKLLEYLRRFRAKTGHKITVVFDAGLSYKPASTRKQGGITVQFAPSGKTADELIIRRVRRVKNPQAVRVVTADRVVQRAAQQAGVQVVSTTDFARQLIGGEPSDQTADPGSQPDVSLSPGEVDEWLDIFNNR